MGLAEDSEVRKLCFASEGVGVDVVDLQIHAITAVWVLAFEVCFLKQEFSELGSGSSACLREFPGSRC